MRVLADTCIISDLYRSEKAARLQKTLNDIGEENYFISVVSLGEINKGIHLLDEGKRKKDLLAWIELFEKEYADRILPVNVEIAKTWGALTAKCQRSGKKISAADGLIAASAICHGLHVMTGNTKDFEPTGALVINPY